MDLKNIQGKLKVLRDRIRNQGTISADDERELKTLIRKTLESANTELEDIRGRLNIIVQNKSRANDNKILQVDHLTHEQKTKLELVEKSGVNSSTVH